MAKIHVTTKSVITHKQDWLGHFIGQANQKVTELQLALVTSVRQKFNFHSPWDSSLPGDYPRRVKGNLKKSITVRDVNLRNVLGFEIATEGKYAGRVGRLQRGYIIQSSRTKPLAIPISAAARRASADGKGPIAAFGWRLKKIVRTISGKKVMLLVERGAFLPHPGMPKYQREQKEQSGGATVHYILKFGTVRIKPRKGLSDAIMESMPLISQHLGGNWK